MHRLRLILGSALALVLAGGSAVIIYTDRPVMRLRDAANVPVVSPSGVEPPSGGTVAPTARGRDDEEGEEGDDDEAGEGEGGVLPAVPAPAPAPAPSTQPSTGSAPAAPAPGTYSMTDVRGHASSSSCWSAIHGNVYDLTDWINRHPGGSNVIIALCGNDGTAAYDGQHGGQQRPLYYLSLLKIGTLR